jgi:hypothetical protein
MRYENIIGKLDMLLVATVAIITVAIDAKTKNAIYIQ